MISKKPVLKRILVPIRRILFPHWDGDMLFNCIPQNLLGTDRVHSFINHGFFEAALLYEVLPINSFNTFSTGIL